MPSVTFRLPPTLHERFVKLCEERDITPSELFRQSVERMVDAVDDAGYIGPSPVKRKAPPPQTLQITGPKPIGFATDGSPIYAGRERPAKGKHAR